MSATLPLAGAEDAYLRHGAIDTVHRRRHSLEYYVIRYHISVDAHAADADAAFKRQAAIRRAIDRYAVATMP